MAFSSFNSIHNASINGSVSTLSRVIQKSLLSSLSGYAAGMQIIPDTTLGIVSADATYNSTTQNVVSPTYSGGGYRNGTYTFTDSNTASTGLTFGLMYKATTPNTFTEVASIANSYVSLTAVGASTVVSGTSIKGEWIQFSTPYRFILGKINLLGRPTYSTCRYPRNYYIAGSNDGITWTQVYTANNADNTFITNLVLSPTPTVAYSYYRLIANTICSNAVDTQNVLNVGVWTVYSA